MPELITSKQGSITCNFDQIQAHLQEQLSLYKNQVFTEETKKEAKNAVAELRKEKKAFQDRIKEVKAEFMKPFDEFYNKASVLVDLFDEPINAIDDQIKAFEVARIEEKSKRINALYEELVPEEDMQEIIPLKKIRSSKWENATCTEKQIKDEIMARKVEAKQAITTLKAMDSDKVDQAIEMYKESFDLSASLLFLSNYEKQKKEIVEREQEQIRQQEIERIRSEERMKIQQEQEHAEALREAQEEARAEVVETLIPEDEEGAPELLYTYDITLTEKQKEALEIYMNTAGIKFEVFALPM